jgi:hypothetical protein
MIKLEVVKKNKKERSNILNIQKKLARRDTLNPNVSPKLKTDEI